MTIRAESEITLTRVVDGARGATGEAGKSAFQAAQEAGYSGTEASFNSDLADVSVTKETATNALNTAESILIYDHGYVIQNDVAYFTAYLYKGGVDVKTEYDEHQFTWWYKDENSTTLTPIITDGVHQSNCGYTCTVNLSDVGYGRHIVGHFTTSEDSQLLTRNDDALITSTDDPITVRTQSGESVRVNNLTVETTLYSTDKLLIVGSEDEHLVSIQTLQNYLNAHLDKQVLFNTTSGWSAQTTLVSDANTLYVYTDHQTDSQGNDVAGIKVGDGSAYVVDLPFTDAVATEHINDSTIHITNTERNYWNNKVRCYYTGIETLVFTTSA